MKKMKLLGVLMLAVLALQGCSEEIGDDIEEVGHDIKRDVKDALD